MSHAATIISRSGAVNPASGELPREFPLKLIVNGKELATLISSPHDLRFLVAGFLRMQGFVRSVDDFEMLSVCEDFGVANVRIKGELPQGMAPVLTSGCGAGISFSVPKAAPVGEIASTECFPVDAILSIFEELSRKASRYRTHGGIHSAAVADGKGLVLFAEDLGRHNAIDRLAGEALLRSIDLRGMLLITSGRISSEMAAKAAHLGITVVASRTSPTDMAVTICNEANITVIGYVRGDRFTVYAHQERIICPKVANITGVILAGGASRRMGSNKALLEVDGEMIIQRIYRYLSTVFDEVIVVTNEPELYAFLGCRTVNDIWPGRGTMIGIHAGITASAGKDAFVVGCDMPYLQPGLIRFLAMSRDDVDVVVPATPDGLQPLHALYRRSCLPVIESCLKQGELSMMELMDKLRTRTVSVEEMIPFDKELISCTNVNTPDQFERLGNNGV